MSEVPESLRHRVEQDSREELPRMVAHEMHDHLRQVVEQAERPPVVENFRERDGVFLMARSPFSPRLEETLPGGVLMVPAYAEVTDPEGFGGRAFAAIATDADLHPQHQSVSEQIARKMKSDPGLRAQYDDLRSRTVLVRAAAGEDPLDEEAFDAQLCVPDNPHGNVYLQLARINEELRAGNTDWLYGNADPSLVALLLTTSQDEVYETRPGALESHRAALAESLSVFRSAHPGEFDEFWGAVEQSAQGLPYLIPSAAPRSLPVIGS